MFLIIHSFSTRSQSLITERSHLKEIKIATTLDEVNKLKEAWNELYHRVPYPGLGAKASWIIQTCELFPENRPHVVYCKNDNQLECVLPLVYLTPTPDMNMKNAVYIFPYVPMFDWCDILCDRKDINSAKEVLDYFFKSLKSGENFYFYSIHNQSMMIRALNEPLENNSSISHYMAFIHRESPFVEFHGSFQDYLESKSSNFREQMRRIVKKVENQSYKLVPLEQTSLAFETSCRFVFENNIQRFKEGSSFHGDPKKLDMMVNVLFEMYNEKRLHVDLLLDKRGDMKACFYEFRDPKHDQAAWFHYGYFDELRPLNIGKYLVFKSLQKAADRGVKFYDLGRGANELKSRLQTGSRPCLLMNLEKHGP